MLSLGSVARLRVIAGHHSEPDCNSSFMSNETRFRMINSICTVWLARQEVPAAAFADDAARTCQIGSHV